MRFRISQVAFSHLNIPFYVFREKGLLGQTDPCWEAAGDLRDPVSDEDFARGMTWDIRLALALLEATSDPQIGGKLWSIYGRLLPQPHTVTVRRCSTVLPHRIYVLLHVLCILPRLAAVYVAPFDTLIKI